jgi:hypothetical protein
MFRIRCAMLRRETDGFSCGFLACHLAAPVEVDASAAPDDTVTAPPERFRVLLLVIVVPVHAVDPATTEDFGE